MSWFRMQHDVHNRGRQQRLFMVLGLLAAVLAVNACVPSRGLSPDEQRVRAVVTRYNEVLMEGFRALDMNRMSDVATTLQAEDEYIYMSSLAEGGVRLDATLVDLEFVNVSIEATSALVETRETWDYRHYGRNDGKLLLEEKGLVYELAYDLERQSDDRWLVSDVRAINATSTIEPDRIATPTPIPPGR